MIFYLTHSLPTLSLGINFKSEPYFRKTLPAVYDGLTPVPAFVMIPEVAAFTLNFFF